MLKDNLIISAIALVFVAGCTQPPARIDMKGGQSFTRGNQSNNSSRSNYNSSYDNSSSSSHNYDTPISEETEQKASVDSIGISDLAPPTATKSEVKSEVQQGDEQTPAPVTLEKKSGRLKPVLKTTVNPWTNKPRSALEKKLPPIKKEVKIAVKEEKTIVGKKTVSSELKWPVEGKKIISSFGTKGAGKANDGINIAAEDGDPVWAAAGGQVVYVSNKMKEFGNMVLIKHKGGRTTSYAHLSNIIVDKYDRVEQGDVIGYVGTTGNVKTPQLFFSLHKGKEAIDPQRYMNKEIAGL